MKTNLLKKRINEYKMSQLTEMLMYIFIILIFVPIISRKVDGEIVLSIYCCLILSMYFDSKVKNNIYNKCILFVFAGVIYFMIRYSITDKTLISSIGNMAVYIILIMSTIPLYFFYYVASAKDIRKLFMAIFCCVLFTTFTSFISLCMDLENSKIVTGMGPDTIIYRYHNVCDYLYSYVIGLMGVVSIYIYKLKRRYKSRNSIWWIAAALFMFIVNIMASSMISILCTILVLIVYLLFAIRNPRVRHVVFIILGTLILICLLIYLVDKSIFYNFFHSIASSIKIGNIKYRLLELNESIFGNSEFSFSGRTDLWEASVNSFLNHPFFGVGFLKGREQISAHSQILDDLAKVGIVGYMFILTLFFGVAKMVNKVKKTNGCILFWAVIVGTIIFSFMNLSNCMPLSFLVFVMLPILARYENKIKVAYKNKTNKQKQDAEYVKANACLNEKLIENNDNLNN